jgi:hypothetical protein
LRSAIKQSISSLGSPLLLPTSLVDILETTECGLELPPLELEYPLDSLRLTDKARSKSVILARSALWDLKRKCCSLVLRGRDWVGGDGKNPSSPVLTDSVLEDRRGKVGVISGVGRPVLLIVMLHCDEDLL